MNYVLCELDELPDSGVKHVADPSGECGFGLILVHVHGELRVFRNQCPHAGRPLDWAPGRFILDTGRLVCAAHGASFNLPDGSCAGGPCRGEGLSEVPVAIEDGRVVTLA